MVENAAGAGLGVVDAVVAFVGDAAVVLVDMGGVAVSVLGDAAGFAVAAAVDDDDAIVAVVVAGHVSGKDSHSGPGCPDRKSVV